MSLIDGIYRIMDIWRKEMANENSALVMVKSEDSVETTEFVEKEKLNDVVVSQEPEKIQTESDDITFISEPVEVEESIDTSLDNAVKNVNSYKIREYFRMLQKEIPR